MLKSGQEFKELKDSHVIFIYKRDKFRKDIHYKELAQGVKHYKETEEGRENMSEKLEKYAQWYAKEKILQVNIEAVNNLMDSMKISLDQALNALKIQGEERTMIIKQLQK